MITIEEKQKIIDLAVEKALLMIPDVVGNLMVEHANLIKLNKKLYEDYPEFKGKQDIVASVIEMTEGKNTLDKYEKILEKAVPEIQRRIETVKGLDMKNVSSTPNRDFKNIDVPQADRIDRQHGEI